MYSSDGSSDEYQYTEPDYPQFERPYTHIATHMRATGAPHTPDAITAPATPIIPTAVASYDHAEPIISPAAMTNIFIFLIIIFVCHCLVSIHKLNRKVKFLKQIMLKNGAA